MGIYGILACAISAVITVASGYLNLGAILIPIIATVLAYFLFDSEVLILVAVSAVIMVIRNRHDLMHILQGKEKKMFRKEKKD